MDLKTMAVPALALCGFALWLSPALPVPTTKLVSHRPKAKPSVETTSPLSTSTTRPRPSAVSSSFARATSPAAATAVQRAAMPQAGSQAAAIDNEPQARLEMTYEERFYEERYDGNWASVTEKHIAEYFASAPESLSDPASVECRSSLCRMELDPLGAEDALDRLTSTPDALLDQAGYVERQAATGALVAFVSRAE